MSRQVVGHIEVPLGYEVTLERDPEKPSRRLIVMHRPETLGVVLVNKPKRKKKR